MAVDSDYLYLKTKFHGVGLVGVFEKHRDQVPEFKDELIFKAFLIAFNEHVVNTIQRDSDSHPVTHWWERWVRHDKEGVQPMYFADSSNDHARRLFNRKGKKQLAENLAERTFKLIELYFTVGSHARFLGKERKDGSLKYFQVEANEEMSEEKTQTTPVEYETLVPQENSNWMEERLAANSSKPMISKRSPTRPAGKLTNAERQQRFKENKKKREQEQNSEKAPKVAMSPAERKKNQRNRDKANAGKTTATTKVTEQ